MIEATLAETWQSLGIDPAAFATRGRTLSHEGTDPELTPWGWSFGSHTARHSQPPLPP